MTVERIALEVARRLNCNVHGALPFYLNILIWVLFIK